MSNKMMWALVVEGATPDSGYFTLANFASKERAELEMAKLESSVDEIVSNTENDDWGGWDVFPSRYRIEPVPAVVEDDEEFKAHGYFLVFTAATFNEDRTRVTREIEHVTFGLSSAQMLDLDENSKYVIQALHETDKKYVQWQVPQYFDGENVVYESLCAFNVADIPLEVDVSEVGK